MAAAAHWVALSWCFATLWHFQFHGTQITWGYAVVDASAAAVFWRQARRTLVALPLYYVHVACVLLYFATTVFKVSDWWVIAVANRLFEFELLYLIGCALYRLRKTFSDKRSRRRRVRAFA